MSLIQVAVDSRFSSPPSGFACVTRTERPGVNRVTPGGELDIATAPQLEDALSDAARDAVVVILDLSELTFMDSSGLHAILNAHARLGEADRRVVLIAGGPQVQRIFQITGVGHHLEFASAPDAFRSR